MRRKVILLFAIMNMLAFTGSAYAEHDTCTIFPRQRERMMSVEELTLPQICRREWKRIDLDFNYKWPVLFFYLDQRPENRPLTLGYIRRIRDQLGRLIVECYAFKGPLLNIVQIDGKIANIERLLMGQTPIEQYSTRASQGAGFLCTGPLFYEW